jgi:hypothetical protein
MPYASDRDRNPEWAEIEQAPWPAPPTNLFLTSGFEPGVVDLVWDDPASLRLNSRFHICGVNLYRSFDSEFGPYYRLTTLPVGAIFWRDQTDNVLIEEEVVEDDHWVLRGIPTAESKQTRYVFCTQQRPIVKSASQAVPADSISDVIVRVDGVVARLLRVDGHNGEVEIDPMWYPEVATQLLDPAVVPGTGSITTVTYRYNRQLVRTNLAQRIFYRATTVGVPVTMPLEQAQPQDLKETPLERAAFTSSFEIEKLDYIWREAVRRNQWILTQGGERVRVFIRKQSGILCPCSSQKPQHKQPQNDCLQCYGTGFLGGYEGPYNTVIAPDDAERRIAQKDIGRTLEHTYEVWAGPSPLLSQRDFLVKLNGDRYSIGPVRMPTNRGMVLQQHFNIGHIDEPDIRYRVPMDNPYGLVATQLSAVIPPEHLPAEVTDKPNIPNERELRGRTKVWENITYAFPFFLLLRTLIDAAFSGMV